MDLYAARLDVARQRAATPGAARGRVCVPWRGRDQHGVPPRPALPPPHAEDGRRGEGDGAGGRGAMPEERKAAVAGAGANAASGGNARRSALPHESVAGVAGAGSPWGGIAADGRRGEGGVVDGRGEAELAAGGGGAGWWWSGAVARRGVATGVLPGAGAGAADGAQGVPGWMVAPGAARGGGEAGTKRPSAPPPLEHHPLPKRRAVSATRRFPPSCGRDAASPLGGADGGSRFRAAWAGADSGALEKVAAAAAPPPPALPGYEDGLLSGAVPPSSACASVINQVSGADGAGPCPTANGGGCVPASRLLAKQRIVSANRRFPPGCGSDAVPLLAVQVHLRLGPGRADSDLVVSEEMVSHGDSSASAAHGQGPETVATPCGSGTGDGALQGDELEEGEIPPSPPTEVQAVPEESQVSVNVTLHMPTACRQEASVPEVSTINVGKVQCAKVQCGEKRPSCVLTKDFKVMNSRAERPCNVAAVSLSEGPPEDHLRCKRLPEIAKMDKVSSEVAARVSGEGATMRSKAIFTPRKVVKPAKVIQKSALDTQHTQHTLFPKSKESGLERHVTPNEIEDTDEFAKVLVKQALVSSEKCSTTQAKGKEAATDKVSFGPRKKVKVKDLGHLQMKVIPACLLFSKEKLDGKMGSNLEDDDVLKALAVREGKLEFYLSSSANPSTSSQRQYGVQNTDARSKVKMICRRFEFICRTIAQAVDQRSLKVRRIDLAADKAIRTLPGFTKHDPYVGQVPGVEIGDEFLYRVQLAIVGLHRPYQGGIDWTKDRNGILVAISIVASGGYPDKLSSSDELEYTGSGGKLAGKKASEDQKLERGNLALKNCIRTKSPVRVIHGFKIQSTEGGSHSRAKEITTFTYDGLYHVVEFWREGPPGSKVLKYKLKRIPGQPVLPHCSKAGIMCRRLGQRDSYQTSNSIVSLLTSEEKASEVSKFFPGHIKLSF